MSALKFASIEKPYEFCRNGVANFTVRIGSGINDTAFICSPCRNALERPDTQNTKKSAILVNYEAKMPDLSIKQFKNPAI